MKIFTKIAVLVLMGVLLTAFSSVAETRYVTHNLVITLRTGPSSDRKIIAQPQAGTPLEIITPGEDYTEVKTPRGKQGWVLTRYLTSRVPADVLLARLQKEHTQVVNKYEALKQQANQLDTTSKGLTGDLSATQSALEKLTTEHETLKRESQGFLKLKAKYQQSVKEATELRARADKVDKELQQLYSSQLNTGLLYGGGLIVLGFIVGFIVKRPKRRSPLM
ncbi:MAG: TIGR04211 family SH3 domain-containing protein [Desulfobacteraceae bacterium]|jgi:SH3 domain protein